MYTTSTRRLTVGAIVAEPLVIPPGEREITHRHYTWESFKDRVQVANSRVDWPSRPRPLP